MKTRFTLILLVFTFSLATAQDAPPKAFFDDFRASPDSCAKAEMDRANFITWMRMHYPTAQHLEKRDAPLKFEQVLSVSPLGVKAMTDRGIELVQWSHFPDEYRSKLGLTSDVVELYSKLKSVQTRDLNAQRQSAIRESQDGPSTGLLQTRR